MIIEYVDDNEQEQIDEELNREFLSRYLQIYINGDDIKEEPIMSYSECRRISEEAEIDGIFDFKKLTELLSDEERTRFIDAKGEYYYLEKETKRNLSYLSDKDIGELRRRKLNLYYIMYFVVDKIPMNKDKIIKLISRAHEDDYQVVEGILENMQEGPNQHFTNDEDIMTKAIFPDEENGFVTFFKYAGKDIRKNKELILRMAKSARDDEPDMCNEYSDLWVPYIDEKLLGDKEFMTQLIGYIGSAIEYASDELVGDKDLIRLALRDEYSDVSPLDFDSNLILLKDKEFVREVVDLMRKQGGWEEEYLQELLDFSEKMSEMIGKHKDKTNKKEEVLSDETISMHILLRETDINGDPSFESSDGSEYNYELESKHLYTDQEVINKDEEIKIEEEKQKSRIKELESMENLTAEQEQELDNLLFKASYGGRLIWQKYDISREQLLKGEKLYCRKYSYEDKGIGTHGEDENSDSVSIYGIGRIYTSEEKENFNDEEVEFEDYYEWIEMHYDLENIKAQTKDKSLTDEQLEEYGLTETHEKQQAVIDSAVEKIEKYVSELPNGERIVLAEEQIPGGAAIAYEKGINYYASASNHLDKDRNVDGVTFAVTSKPGVKLPENVLNYGQELVEKYRTGENTSEIFVNPNGQMIVAGGFKNPEFKIEGKTVKEMLNEILSKFTQQELEQNQDQDEQNQ